MIPMFTMDGCFEVSPHRSVVFYFWGGDEGNARAATKGVVALVFPLLFFFLIMLLIHTHTHTHTRLFNADMVYEEGGGGGVLLLFYLGGGHRHSFCIITF